MSTEKISTDTMSILLDPNKTVNLRFFGDERVTDESLKNLKPNSCVHVLRKSLEKDNSYVYEYCGNLVEDNPNHLEKQNIIPNYCKDHINNHKSIHSKNNPTLNSEQCQSLILHGSHEGQRCSNNMVFNSKIRYKFCDQHNRVYLGILKTLTKMGFQNPNIYSSN
jgi:hypothetical protein